MCKIRQPIKVKGYVIVDWLATVLTDVIVPSPVHFPNNLKSHTIVPLKFVLKHFINSSHIIYSYTSEWQIQWEQPDEDYKISQNLSRTCLSNISSNKQAKSLN